MATYYIHKWAVPIIVLVNNTLEHWYNAPSYNRRHLPVKVD